MGPGVSRRGSTSQRTLPVRLGARAPRPQAMFAACPRNPSEARHRSTRPPQAGGGPPRSRPAPRTPPPIPGFSPPQPDAGPGRFAEVLRSTYAPGPISDRRESRDSENNSRHLTAIQHPRTPFGSKPPVCDGSGNRSQLVTAQTFRPSKVRSPTRVHDPSPASLLLKNTMARRGSGWTARKTGTTGRRSLESPTLSSTQVEAWRPGRAARKSVRVGETLGRLGFQGGPTDWKRPTRGGEIDRSGSGAAPVAAAHGRPIPVGDLAEIVGILRANYDRGPVRAKTHVLDDIVVVVMRGSGFTPLEQTIMDSGEDQSAESVVAMRENFQRVIASRYKQKIEELTNRKVLAFLSQAHVEPDITIEIFFVDGPLEGFGAVEVVDPGRRI
jgi:uncharacterized protein YbcI